MGALCLIGKYFCCQRILETFLAHHFFSWKIWIDHCRGKKLAQWYCGPLKTRGYFLSSPPCFSLDTPTGGVESTSLRSVCLSVITSRFRIIRNISIFGIQALYIIPGSCQTPHIIYCRLREDVRYISSGDDNNTHKYKDTDKDKDKYKDKMLQWFNICYIYEKHGLQGFQILYWLSSGNNNYTHKYKC